MASPILTSRSAAGSTIYAGRFPSSALTATMNGNLQLPSLGFGGGFSDGTLPAWIPTAGRFNNVGLNNFLDANPCPPNNCAWSFNTDGPKNIFFVWCGGVWAPECGSQGQFLIWGGGHGSYNGNEIYGWDVATRSWVCHGIPSPYTETDLVLPSPFYPDGKPLPPHTYGLSNYMPPAWGGGSLGSLMQFGMTGASVTQATHRMDLATGQWSSYSTGGFGNTYGCSVIDRLREGWWVIPSVGNVFFVSKTFTSTQQTAATGRNSAAQNMTCLMADKGVSGVLVDHSLYNGGGPRIDYLDLEANATNPNGPAGGWKTATIGGAGVSGYDYENGFEYCPELNAIIWYRQGDNFIRKLTVPAVLTDTWIASTETILPMASEVVGIEAGNTKRHWRRFVWVPTLRSFLWVAGGSVPVQAWRPTGV